MTEPSACFRLGAKDGLVQSLPGLTARDFSGKLLRWHKRQGRKGLPWQEGKTPYRVWVSEIMLQQTQVATVIPYFQKFMQRFPTVHQLAGANIDEVLHLWTGLGYYARARNLHLAAGMVVNELGGEFPLTVDGLMALPGVGRSTAGAVVALCTGKKAAILDGNVKRVLARCFAIEGWPGKSATAKRLWEKAEALTPSRQVAAYTQAIMDLGALVCRRSSPNCNHCPFIGQCLAQVNGQIDRYPGSKPSKQLPVRQTVMLVIKCGDEVLLEQRPSTGLWGGLWGFPEPSACKEPSAQDNSSAEARSVSGYPSPASVFNLSIQNCLERLGLESQAIQVAPKSLPGFRHTFTHFHLDINPVLLELDPTPRVAEPDPHKRWYNPHKPDEIGLTKPVITILQMIS